MTNDPSKKRFYALDAFRGLAALMVALFHFKLGNSITESALVTQAWLFVDFFFVLSGFVIAHAYYYERSVKPAAFVRARIARLYPLYLYALLVMLAFETLKYILHQMGYSIFTNPPFAENDAKGFLLNIALLNSFNFDPLLTWNTPGWSISAELWVNILCALLLALPLFPGRFIMVAVAASMGGLVALLALGKGLDLTFDYGWLRCLAGFGLGMIAYALHRRSLPLGRVAAGLEIPALAVMLAVVVYYAQLWAYLPPFIFAAGIYLFAQEKGMISRLLRAAPFQMLGAISYAVYLNHVIVAIIMEKAVKLAFPALSETLSLAATAAYLGLVILYSYLTHRYIEVPARKALAAPTPRAPLSPSPRAA